MKKPAGADVAAHFGQADPADQLAVRIPYRDATIADGAAGIARRPDVAVDIAAHAVRPALHAIDHEVAEAFLVRQLVVGTDIEHRHVALATRNIRFPFIELAAIGRVGEPAAAVGMGDDVIGRVEFRAAEIIGEHGRGAVVLVAHHAAGEMSPGSHSAGWFAAR